MSNERKKGSTRKVLLSTLRKRENRNKRILSAGGHLPDFRNRCEGARRLRETTPKRRPVVGKTPHWVPEP